MTAMARLFALIPLRLMHFLGAMMGWLIYWADARYAQRLRENLQTSGIATEPAAFQRLLRRSITSAGKAFLEIFVIWFRPEAEVLKLVREVQGWEHVEAARAAGKGMLLLTPHLGCFEIAGLYSGSRFPFTELYRPPKFAWLEPWMRAGRARGHIDLATTDYAGVKKLLAALRRGEAVGALPDQVPSQGDGAWADFFGRPAYTMTLMARLQQKTGAAIICFYARRLEQGRGYVIRYMPSLPPLSDSPEQAARQINAALEALIRDCPEQYLWSYNRYKGTPPEGAVHSPRPT
jgi:Kdo2-lipid IVA lauroyltransferase/acyltransferase